MNTIIKFIARDGSMAEATATLKTFEDQEHGLHTVTRSLPAGMDIGPDIWRFEHVNDALLHFGAVQNQIESRGFKPQPWHEKIRA